MQSKQTFVSSTRRRRRSMAPATFYLAPHEEWSSNDISMNGARGETMCNQHPSSCMKLAVALTSSFPTSYSLGLG